MDDNINIDNEDNELLKLDNQLCFSLYVCSKEIIKKYKPLLDPLGLTYTSYITLLALWEQDDINVKDLGKKLYLDSGTLTPILKKLELQNFITRTRSTEDERSVNISLTKEGILLKEKARNVYSELACSLFNNSEELSSGMELLGSLHKLMNTFNQNI